MGLFGKKKRKTHRGGQAAAQQNNLPQAENRAVSSRKKRRRKRHKSNRILYYILVLFILLVVGVALSLTVFFKITAISVKGVSKYPVSVVQQLTGISAGDNLFRVDLGAAKEKIMELPYVEDVTLRRSYPPEIVVEVTQAQPVAALEEENGGYTLISADGRILERDAQLPDNLLQVVGAELKGDPGAYPAKPPKKASEEELAAADVRMPYLIGYELTVANNVLMESGLRCRTVGTGNKVVAQIPRSGTTIPGSSTIILYLSGEAPTEEIEVPDITGLTVPEAKEKLEAMGLFLRPAGVVDYTDPDVTAAEQLIEAGTMVKPGTVIEARFVSNVIDFVYDYDN